MLKDIKPLTRAVPKSSGAEDCKAEHFRSPKKLGDFKDVDELPVYEASGGLL